MEKKHHEKYGVLCRLIDCEDDWGQFLLEDDDGSPIHFDTLSDAIKAMKEDYVDMCETLDTEPNASGDDPCKRTVEKRSISIDIPIWDGENNKDSWVHAKWEVVKI